MNLKEERRVLGLLRNEPASSATASGIVYLHNSILRIVLLLQVVLHSSVTRSGRFHYIYLEHYQDCGV